jgi:hypothetical protein
MTIDEPFYLGLYWGARCEPVEVCAGRLASCLASLGRCSVSLGSWSTRAGDVDADADALRELLLAGVNRRDAGASPIEELGFSVGLWNRDRQVPIGVSVTCGSWSRRCPGVCRPV